MSVRDRYWSLVDVVAQDDRRALQVGLFVSLLWLVIVDAIIIIGVEQGWIVIRQVGSLPSWVPFVVTVTSGVLSVIAYLGMSQLVRVFDEHFE